MVLGGIGGLYLLGSEGESMGRYLFLKPQLGEEAREVSVTTDDQEFIAAFAAASEAVLVAWEEGSFFPRLVKPDGREEPIRCSYCAVAEACLRGDSGARKRLSEWTLATPEAAEPGFGEEALLRVWRLWDPHPPTPSPPPSLPRSPGEGRKGEGGCEDLACPKRASSEAAFRPSKPHPPAPSP